MAKLITGVFKTRSSAQLAVEDLAHHGYSLDDISMLMANTAIGREFTIGERTKSAEGLSVGAAVGGILGALVAGFTAVGLIAAPGLEMYASGQWIAGLAGMGAGMLGGGLIGGLIGLSVPEHEAMLNRADLSNAGILVGVFAVNKDRIIEAMKVLDAAGAAQIKTENVQADKPRGRTIESPRPVDKSGFTYT